MPVSCYFKESVQRLIANEIQSVNSRLSRLETQLAMADTAEDRESINKFSNELRELESQIVTLEGYKNIIDKEKCVE